MQTISTLVADQNSQNKNLEENWVGVLSGAPTSQGQDLQSAISGFTPDASVASPARPSSLPADMGTFDTDAGAFLNDQSGGLQPGWPTEAGAIEQDIKSLADDCKIKFIIPKGYTV